MKNMLSFEELENQTAFELPDRELPLITVVVFDVLNGLTVQVPVGVAANLCDINAAVLVQEFQDTGTADCTATADSQATQGPGNRPNR